MVFVKKLILLLLSICLNANASFQVSAFNIRNYDKNGENTDKKELVKIIESLDSDLISIEEIYNNTSFEKLVKSSLPNYALSLSRCGGGGKQNIGFLYRKDRLELLNTAEDTRLADPYGTVSTYGCGSLRPGYLGFFMDKETEKKFVAMTVHLKAGSGSQNYAKRAIQYNLLTKITRELRLAGHNDILIMGDFNTTGFDAKDDDYKNFSSMLTKSGTDTASKNLKCTSYWSGENHNDDIEEPSTLDHIVYSGNLLGLKLKEAKVSTHCQKANCEEVYNSVLGVSYESVSDHCPVTAKFE